MKRILKVLLCSVLILGFFPSAACDEKTYTVTFFSRTGEDGYSVQVEAGSRFEAPDCTFQAPEGMKFDGWRVYPKAVMPFTLYPKEWTAIESDTVFKANWAYPPQAGTVRVSFLDDSGYLCETVTINGQKTALANVTAGQNVVIKMTFDRRAEFSLTGIDPAVGYSVDNDEATISYVQPAEGSVVSIYLHELILLTWDPNGGTPGKYFPEDGVTESFKDIEQYWMISIFDPEVMDYVRAPEGKSFCGLEIISNSGSTVYGPDDELIFPATEDCTIKFLWDFPHTITVTSSEGGTASADRESAVVSRKIKLNASAEKGYEFTGWEVVNGNVTIKDNSFAMADSDVEIMARFEKIVYEVTEGGNATWTKDSGKDLTLRVERTPNNDSCFDHFDGVAIDDTVLDPFTDFSAVSGSTIVTISADALQKLTAGDHSLVVCFDDGYVETGLKIKVPEAPNTSDRNNPLLWVSLLMLSQTVAAGLWISHKKNNQ